MSKTAGAVRREILAAGRVQKSKDRGRAFNRIAAHYEISRQAVELWWRSGRIPPERQESFADLVKAGQEALEAAAAAEQL